MFFKLGCAQQNLRIQIYPHVLPGRDAIVEWVKGAYLTPYQKKLDPATYILFLEHYTEELFKVLPDERPILYPYRRYLMWARKKA